MIDDEDAYFQNSADSLTLIALFDSLPDYCRTKKFWQQLKALCPPALLSKLKPIDYKDSNTHG